MTWREMIEAAMAKNGEAGAPVSVTIQRWDDWTDQAQEPSVKVSLDHPDLAVEPGELEDESGYSVELRFTVWTPERVYFPAMYDSRYWVASVPRAPCLVATPPIGG